jgi:hypothetical protein
VGSSLFQKPSRDSEREIAARIDNASQRSQRWENWLAFSLIGLGLTALAFAFGYLFLTDPAAEVVAMRAQQALTQTAKSEPLATATTLAQAAQANPPSDTQTLAPAASPTFVATPTALPVLRATDALQGDVRWTAANGPLLIDRNISIPVGSRLTIEPGTELWIASGVSFQVDGQLVLAGRPDTPVILRSEQADSYWEGIYGNPGSTITIEASAIQGAGATGTIVLSQGDDFSTTTLNIRNVYFTKNKGMIVVRNSALDMRDSLVSGNLPPYGGMLNANYNRDQTLLLSGNSFVDNKADPTNSMIWIGNELESERLSLLIQRNLISNNEHSINLQISAQSPMEGMVTCNTLEDGTFGLSILGSLPQIPGMALDVYNNIFAAHSEPGYEQSGGGIGRAASSTVNLRMYGNWWGDASGPFHPFNNPNGRGEAVGENIEFTGWLRSPPSCAPTQ